MCRVSCTFKSWGHTYCTPVGLILNMWNTAPGQPALPPSVFPLPFKQYTVSVWFFLVLFFMLKSKNKKRRKKQRNDYVITPPKFPHVPELDSIPLTGKIIHKVANIYWSYIIAEASWASPSTFFQRYSPPAQVCLLTPLLSSLHPCVHKLLSPPHWQTHFVFAEGFCMFFFLFTLSTLTHEKIYRCKNKSEGENLLTVALKLFSAIWMKNMLFQNKSPASFITSPFSWSILWINHDLSF